MKKEKKLGKMSEKAKFFKERHKNALKKIKVL
jgi:hypothetical protein